MPILWYRISNIFPIDPALNLNKHSAEMKHTLFKAITVLCLTTFVAALVTPAEARRTTTSTPPPTVGTDDKPAVSAL